MKQPRIAVLYGGVSQEREVSLGSGQAAAASLGKFFEVDLIDVAERDRLPDGLDGREQIVFSTLHGSFGEDGAMQSMMDAAGVIYAGCDAKSSALTFDKVATKKVMKSVGVPVADEIAFDAGHQPAVSEIRVRLGSSLVIKPVAEGSSVGLQFAGNEAELEQALADCASGRWMVEPRLAGLEATVGVLGGEALGVVEIAPKSGAFDYRSKYTKGLTEYIAPARLEDACIERIRKLATTVFSACDCRDYARIDLIVDRTSGEPCFLEVNTLPGLKETSLLPMSAGLCGYDFDELLQKLVEPALMRYRERYSNS